MRKYLLIILISFFHYQSFSENDHQAEIREEIKQLRGQLPNLHGIPKVDALNKLAYNYFALWINWKLEADSASPFAIQAQNEAKRIGYKKGLAYAYIRLGEANSAWFGFDIQVNRKYDIALLKNIELYAKKAIAIGQQINDNAILGAAHWLLAWWEYDKKSSAQPNYSSRPDYSDFIIALEKAAFYYQKVNKEEKYQGFYRDLNEFSCDECTGAETAIFNLYSNCASYGDRKNIQKLEGYINKAIEYAIKANDKRRTALGYERLAQVNTTNEQIESNLNKAISIYREIRDEQNEMSAINSLCGMYFNAGEFEKGLDYGKRSMFLFNKRKHKASDEFDWGVLWMSNFYQYAGDYETALKFLYLLHAHYDDQLPRELRNGNIGELHRLMGNYDSAMYYLAAFSDTSIYFSPAKAFLGNLYIDLKQYDKGLQLIKDGLTIDKKKGLPGPVARDNNAAAKVYYLKGDYNSALNYARDGLATLKKIRGKVYMVENYKLHADIFSKLGNNDSAYYYLNLYTTLKDSLLNRQFYFRLNSYKKESEEERRTSQINLLNKDNQLKQQKLKQEAFVKNILIIGLIVLLVLGVLVFRTLSLKRKNEKLTNEKKQSELQQKVSDLEMQALRAQMNPHFIFNCLSSINRFILKNETEAASDYLTRFSRLIRMVLINSQKSLISLEDEIEMLKLYLDMERLRFKNSFDYNITFSNTVDVGSILIAPLLLQPFCENAIWHGLMHKREQGRLDITMSADDNILNCTIADNGIGRKKAAEIKSVSGEKNLPVGQAGKSLGLKITKERLALLNNETDLNTFYEIEDMHDDEGNATGTKVNLKIRNNETKKELTKELQS